MQFWGWKKSLEDTVKESPTVENYSAVVKSLQTKGDVAKAWEFIEQAKQKFPRSKEILDLYVTLAKNKWRPEIERLKKLISQGTNSVALVQLAEIYKELGEEEEALTLCVKAIETNDKDDIPHLIVGQIRIERFYKDFFEKDGLLAREHLERSVEINPQNYKALIALAKFYIQIGALKKAEQKLRDILRFAPEDENIKSLNAVISELEKQSIEDIDFLLATVEQDRALFYNLDGRQKREMVLSPDIFQNALDSLHSVADVLCLLVCDEEGTLIAHYAKENVDFNIYYEVTSCIYQNVQNSTRHMDIGKFQRSEVSGPFGCIQMIAADNILYTAFGSSDSRSKIVYQELQNFVSKIPIIHGSQWHFVWQIEDSIIMMQRILQQLNQEVGVKGSMIVEQDGLPAVTELGKELDEEIVAAMASSTIRSTKRALQLLNQSKFDRIILMAAHGRMVFVDLDPAPAILLAVTDKNINIDLTILAIDGAAIRIKNLLMKK